MVKAWIDKTLETFGKIDGCANVAYKYCSIGVGALRRGNSSI
jgi:hypothetical protein